MKERPILFTDAMVRAILDGSKTQTRRVMKPQPWPSSTYGFDWNGHYMGTERIMRESPSHCPYGQPGDRLWVREDFRLTGVYATWTNEDVKRTFDYPDTISEHVAYRATEGESGIDEWRQAMFMPRWASRILLEMTGVRVERVQDIRENDAMAEGVSREFVTPNGGGEYATHVGAFVALWNSINAARGFGWDANPWVWVIEFKRHSQ